MDDTQGFKMIDSAQYVTAITPSSLAAGGDRYTLRGFQISQRFVDGVNVSGVDGYNVSSDTSNVERLEIVKGPDAILVPGGSPGGNHESGHQVAPCFTTAAPFRSRTRNTSKTRPRST